MREVQITISVTTCLASHLDSESQQVHVCTYNHVSTVCVCVHTLCMYMYMYMSCSWGRYVSGLCRNARNRMSVCVYACMRINGV